MKKNHIVILETKDHGWVAYSAPKADAKRLLNVNKHYKIYYIFQCDLERQYPYVMKLKMPLQEHYDCKDVIIYKDEATEDSQSYLTINYDDSDDGVCFHVAC